MRNLIRKSLARAAIATSLGLGALGAAQAGLVTGNLDPAFGAVLPGVSYRYDFSLFVPDSCAGNAPGLVTVSCGAPIAINFNFEIYETANPANSQAWSLNLSTSLIHVLNGFVIGVDADEGGWFDHFEAGPVAPGKLFNIADLGMYFMPEIAVGHSCAWPCLVVVDGFASTDNAVATVFNYDDDGRSKMGYTPSGEAIGYRITNDPQQGFIIAPTATTAVPEPGSLALVLAALGLSLRATRRRQA